MLDAAVEATCDDVIQVLLLQIADNLIAEEALVRASEYSLVICLLGFKDLDDKFTLYLVGFIFSFIMLFLGLLLVYYSHKND